MFSLQLIGKLLYPSIKKDYGNGVDARKWLRKCLLSNGFKGHIEKIYLSTFPKILGIGFNPVSFWYCFDKNKTTNGSNSRGE